jgi:YidC/Oxa1 family membrane protein insertase
MNRDMEYRLLVAFVLSFGILLVWKALFAPVPPPPTPGKHAASKTAAVVSPRVPANSATAKKKATTKKKVVIPVISGAQAQQIVVDTPVYRVTFSTRGALVKSWILKKYRDAHYKPLDLVNTAACAQLGFPMSLRVESPELTDQLNSALYQATPSEGKLTAPSRLTFSYSNGHVEVQKEFSFGPGYGVGVKVSIFDGTGDLPVAVRWPGNIGDQSLPQSERESETWAFYDAGNGIKTTVEKKVNGIQNVPGPFDSAGVEDKFFAGIFLPASPGESFDFERETWRPPGPAEKSMPSPITATLATATPQPLEFRLSLVPKTLNVLAAISPALQGLVHFGIAGIVAKPILVAMQWIHRHIVANWGWTIILLTVVLNMIFFPLKIKQVRSSQEMQKIAPLMKEIQGRYKQYKLNDPRRQRMNQEIMKLYQEHGINPLGGCLPMLPQIPIFFGFYEVLETSIALRHAPWLWWIKDLSVPDPLYILPALGIVISFLMYRMMPMPTTDPNQQRMMMFMPLFMGIIFFRLAAGDNLYYVTFSIIGVLQQLWINRMVPPTKTPAQQKPAEVQAGSGARQRGQNYGSGQGPGSRRPVGVKGK